MLYDIGVRALTFRADMTALGYTPLRYFLSLPGVANRQWSVFYLNDTPVFVGALLVLYLLAALALTLGIRVRLSGWLCWIFAFSVFQRTPLINNLGDRYLIAILFWGNFLPWGRCFSLTRTRPLGTTEHQSLAGFALLVQACLLYWFPPVFRVGAEWQVQHSALYYSLQLRQFETAIGGFLATFGVKNLTFFGTVVLWGEVLGPSLLFLPWARARLAACILMVIFHLSLLTTLYIPNFALTALSAPLGLLPAYFWSTALGARLERILNRAFGWGADLLPEKWTSTHSLGGRFGRWYPRVSVIFLGLVIYAQAQRVPDPGKDFPLKSELGLLGLDQNWDMFAPRPPRATNWGLFLGRLRSGRTVDLRLQSDLRPQWDDYPRYRLILDDRLRALEASLMPGQAADLYLQYQVRRWDSSYPDDPVEEAVYLNKTHTTEPNYRLGHTEKSVWATWNRNE